MAKQNYARLTTPRGVFIYPRLTEADTKFVKPHGEYHTKFALSVKDSEDLLSTSSDVLQAYFDEELPGIKDRVKKAKGAKKVKAEKTAKKAAKYKQNDLYEEEMDDEGNETGRFIFKFKLKAVVETTNKTWDQKPRLFDADAKPVDDINPWTGSEGKCNLELFPYFMEKDAVWGVSLRLKGAQILLLKQGGGESAGDMGFGAEDGGYTSDTSAAANGFGEEETGGSDGEDDDEF